MLANILNNVRIILVNTSHPGNIGSTARAMKTMGLTQLVLVSPKSFPDPQAIAMSSHADDILDNARVVPSLKEALDGCCLAIGTSARSRAIDLQPLDPKTSAEKLIQVLKQTTRQNTPNVDNQNNQTNVALVFGREDSGLTNEELLHCHYHVTIPSNPEYSSLNLGAAVQVLCYELRMANISYEKELSEAITSSKKELPETVTPFEKGGRLLQSNRGDFPSSPLATIDEVEQFYEHLEILLVELAFLKKENTTLMSKIRRIFNRIQLEKPEINILRGILTAVQYERKNNVSH